MSYYKFDGTIYLKISQDEVYITYLRSIVVKKTNWHFGYIRAALLDCGFFGLCRTENSLDFYYGMTDFIMFTLKFYEDEKINLKLADGIFIERDPDPRACHRVKVFFSCIENEFITSRLYLYLSRGGNGVFIQKKETIQLDPPIFKPL